MQVVKPERFAESVNQVVASQRMSRAGRLQRLPAWLPVQAQDDSLPTRAVKQFSIKYEFRPINTGMTSYSFNSKDQGIVGRLAFESYGKSAAAAPLPQP